jgi:hypothetical protein
MAKGDWWFKFEIPAWRNSPELRRCSLETKGFWIECVAIMRDLGVPHIKGSCEEIARSVGCFPEEAQRCVEELKRTNTADVTLRNGEVTLKSRKYAKELKAKEMTRLRVRKHRGVVDVTPDVTDKVKSKKKEVISNDVSSNESVTKDSATQAETAGTQTPVSRRIWTDGVQLLVEGGLTNYNARSLLGKMGRDYGQTSLAECIAATMAANPVNPEEWLMGALKNRKNGNGKHQLPDPGKPPDLPPCDTCDSTRGVFEDGNDRPFPCPTCCAKDYAWVKSKEAA